MNIKSILKSLKRTFRYVNLVQFSDEYGARYGVRHGMFGMYTYTDFKSSRNVPYTWGAGSKYFISGDCHTTRERAEAEYLRLTSSKKTKLSIKAIDPRMD